MQLRRNLPDKETTCQELPAPSPASSEQLLQIKKEMLLSHQTERGRDLKSNSFALYSKRCRAKSPL